MRLYAIPFACSLAAHIALREAGLEHDITWVTRTSLAIDGGGDLRDINPKGKVAALARGDGTLITENIAVLLAIADLVPASRLAPLGGTPARLRLYEWLSFVATELHKQVLWAWFNPDVPQVMKEHVAQRIAPGLLRHPAEALARGPYLLGEEFTVADAYLFWSLLLFPQLGVDVDRHPSLVAFRELVRGRPRVREVLSVERKALAARPG